MFDWELWIWILLGAGAGVFQLLKRLTNRRNEQSRTGPTKVEPESSYRPPLEDVEQFRQERPAGAIRPLEREVRTPEPRHDRALAGDPATEGHRFTVELPPVPEATERPLEVMPVGEGPLPTAAPAAEASSVTRRLATIAATRRSSQLRRNIRNALTSRQRIREAFVLQAVIGQPKGLNDETQSADQR